MTLGALVLTCLCISVVCKVFAIWCMYMAGKEGKA